MIESPPRSSSGLHWSRLILYSVSFRKLTVNSTSTGEPYTSCIMRSISFIFCAKSVFVRSFSNVIAQLKISFWPSRAARCSISLSRDANISRRNLPSGWFEMISANGFVANSLASRSMASTFCWVYFLASSMFASGLFAGEFRATIRA